MFAEVSAVYLHREPVDFRQAINGLSAIIEGAMGLSPFSGAVFVRSSLSALMDSCGEPSDIAPQAEASHIHDGNSRDMPDGASTWTTAPTPRPTRRYSGSR